MKQICYLCSTELDQEKPDSLITHGICTHCSGNIIQHTDSLKKFIDAAEAPILVMQDEPRSALTANQKACSLFERELSQIKGHKGGQLLGCVHAYTAGGCGIGVACKNCKIRDAVAETFTMGKSFKGISEVLQVKKNGEIKSYILSISTEKVGDFALVRIDQYEKKPGFTR